MGFIFSAGKKQSVGSTPPSAAGALQIQTSVQGRPLIVCYGQNRIAPNLFWYDDFVATPVMSQPAQGGGKGGPSKPPAQVTGYTYSAALIMGLCEGPIDGIGTIWKDKDVTTLSALGFTFFNGSFTQAAWSYLTTYHPSAALAYPGTAYLAAGPYDLGDSASLGNHTVEVQALLRYDAAGGIVDADPKAAIYDYLTDTNHGLSVPAANLGDWTAFSNYCVANGFFVSPVFDSQTDMATQLMDILNTLNVAVFESSGILNIVPLGDTAITGNGVTYTPDLTPLFDLTDDDYIVANSDEDPVTATRSSPADAYNQLSFECVDRNDAYNVTVVEAKDQDAIEKYGLRPASATTAHWVTQPSIGRTLAQLMVQRMVYVRNQYKFKLGWKYCVLEPCDRVTISDSNLGLARQLVRILTTEEDDNGNITITAERLDVGVAAAPVYGTEAGSRFAPQYNVDPGLVNTPIIFEPPVELATASNGPEVWCAVSGQQPDIFGGCSVYVSTDNATYKLVDKHNNPTRMGELTADLPSGTDPDTTNTIAVDLSQSHGQLLGGTQADADAGHSLCYVDGELISYQDATLVSQYNYDLGTYLRRGMYGTTIKSHLSGSEFARLDETIFTVPYSKDQIGQTIYLKFVPFNVYGSGAKSLSDVTAYTYTIKGPPPPSNVTGFVVKQNGGAVTFRWNQISDYALKGYDIGYAPQGTTDWSQFQLLTEADKGTEMTNASVQPGSWTFGIRARDVVDQLSPAATTQDLIVTNENEVIADVENSKDWFGTTSGFVRHWTGVLIPSDQFGPAHYGWELFDNFVNTPVASCTYTAPTIDTGYDDSLRIYYNNTSALGPGQAGDAPSFLNFLDSWKTGATDPNVYSPWTIGTLTLRYFNGRIEYQPVAGNVSYLKTFEEIADKSPTVEQFLAQTIAAGGTDLAFNPQYHFSPFVQATVIGNTPLYATAVDVTPTQCTVHVWDHLGNDVGGTVNVTVNGE